jgi:hypothetical protein
MEVSRHTGVGDRERGCRRFVTGAGGCQSQYWWSVGARGTVDFSTRRRRVRSAEREFSSIGDYQ